MSFLSYLKDGISLGSIYAIIALGYTMVYGIAKMLNFAHGDVIMVGAYVILTAVTRGGMSPVLAVALSVIFCTVLGMVIEKVAYSPLRKASSNLAVLITAIGVSYLLQNLALLIFILAMTKHKKFHGEFFYFYLFFYGLGRFWIEGLRTDQLKMWVTGFPVSQALALVLMAIALILFALGLHKSKQNNAQKL